MGISQATYCSWRKQYAGARIAELRELRQSRKENARSKRLVADLSLDRQIPQEIASEKGEKPRVRRELGRWTQGGLPDQ
jgi:putative transposase